ncbi:NADP-dependent oxidoreductase [Terriglobus sp.]|uniref:NADP-dependent oxidoreductase n=1 Tax=Terriglobus sp. TaxID=1889013 RepID=UPI003AFFF750
MPETASVTTRTIRFHSYGEPADVLRLEETTVHAPASQRVRMKVRACGLNPADWALCRGLFAGNLPRGIGLEAAGIVDAVGEDVRDVEVGQLVFGPVDFVSTNSAGASDYAILQHWTPVPSGLDEVHAAALPMAVAIAYGSLDSLGVEAGRTVLINGAGTTVGFAAVQISLGRGARVIATAGDTFAARLRALGAVVTAYGDGLPERVAALPGKQPDLILDTAPVSGALPALVQIAADPKRVMTISDFEAAKALGVRSNLEEPGMRIRYDVLHEFADLAAQGKFLVPIARTFPLDDWKTALSVSEGQQARGKLILLP